MLRNNDSYAANAIIAGGTQAGLWQELHYHAGWRARVLHRAGGGSSFYIALLHRARIPGTRGRRACG